MELTLPIHHFTLWTDSNVLSWLQSDSCRFKAFVGTRVAEIQDLIDRESWRYVDSARISADNITRGKPLSALIPQSQWSQGPSFLKDSLDKLPEAPPPQPAPTDGEERKAAFF